MAPPMKTKFSASQVASHKQQDDLYIVIHDKVYDVSKWFYQHPGGQSVLLDQGGFDATEAFEEVGHSDFALEILKTYQIGVLNRQPGDEKILHSTGTGYKDYTKDSSKSRQWTPLNLFLAFIFAIAVYAAWSGIA